MNKVYKVLWNEVKQAYVVVSELAKNHGKKSESKVAVLALAALFMTGMAGGIASAADNTAGNGNGVAIGTGSNAPKAENVAIGKDSLIKYSNGNSKATGDVAIGNGSYIDNYASQGGSIAIGKNARVENMAGSQERIFAFGQTKWNQKSFWGMYYGAAIPEDPTKAVASIAIGDNTYARTGSVMIGSHNYKGELGDTKVDSSNTNKLGVDVFATTLGANSFTNGAFATNTGAYNIVSGSYSGGNSDSSKASQNFGATITGSLNSIESFEADNFSGIANSIVGVANRTNNSNGSLIFGAGNVITNSITDLDGTQEVADSAKAFQTSLMDSVKKAEGGGAALAIGGGNTIDYAQKSQVMGVGNTLKGEDGNVSKFNFIDGYKNSAEKVKNVSVLGSNNTVSEAESTQIIGDKRKVTKAKDSVVIGSAEKETELKVNNATILGYNANVTKEGGVALGYNANATVAGGVAIGENSVASTDKGIAGYDISKNAASTETTAVWKSTAAAVSVGDAANDITRQITGVAAGWEDTDAVNVAQLKKVAFKASQAADDAGKHTSVTGDSNITVTKSGLNAAGGDNYQVKLNDTIRVANEVSITNGPSMTTNGIDAAGNKITNVAPGTADTDAVNYGQLQGINQNITNIGNRVSDLDSRVNKVGAGAAALAALHPQDFDSDDKWDFAAGFGNYRDANAVALGAFYRPDHKTMFSVGGSMGNGENMVNVGVSLKFGKSSPYTGMSKAALINKIESQDDRIAKLEQLVQQLLEEKKEK